MVEGSEKAALIAQETAEPYCDPVPAPVHCSDPGEALEAPTGIDLDALVGRIEASLGAAIEPLLVAFDRKLAYDASKQLQIDRLHEELQQHRSDQAARTARPLVQGIVRLHDNIGKLISALREKPAEELSPDRFFAVLAGLEDDVEVLLEHNGVSAYRDPGGSFEPRRQRALRQVATDDSRLAGAVAQSIRPGFQKGSEILEKERVAIYVLSQELKEAPGAATKGSAEDNSAPSGTSKQEG